MDKLLECTKVYETLSNFKYHIVLGKKGKLIHLNINFTIQEFHHLMGLGKLEDIEFFRDTRAKVFNNIITRKITYKHVTSSKYFNKIANRFTPMANIEEILDSNDIVFRYSENKANFSQIEADFLLSTPFNGNDVYLFLSKRENDDYFCRSFFPKTNRDYSKGQARYTMLYKEKINLHTGIVQVQFDKLNNTTT